MARNRRGGYRMYADTDRCAADHNLRHVRESITEGQAALTTYRRQLADATEPKHIAKLTRQIEISVWALHVARENEQRLLATLAELFPDCPADRSCLTPCCTGLAMRNGYCEECRPYVPALDQAAALRQRQIAQVAP